MINESVSLIAPLLNEEKYIDEFLNSILCQDYKKSEVELILVDGNSIDKTLEILNSKLEGKTLKYKVLKNIQKTTPISLNIGIKAATNNIIIRLDAHSYYPTNYISKCVHYITQIKEAENVGCLINTVSNGVIGESIAFVLSSKFGVGNSGFRTNAKSGFVDTVPFGTFRKSLFEKIGYFDERLARNQDSEFNNRILQNGGKIYLFDDIKIDYFPRDTLKKLCKMGFINGKWNVYTNYLLPGTMRLRHFIPFLFVVSLFLGLFSIVFNLNIIKYVFYLEICLYVLLDFIFSFKAKNVIEKFLAFLIFPLFHVSYGIGSLDGIAMSIKHRRD